MKVSEKGVGGVATSGEEGYNREKGSQPKEVEESGVLLTEAIETCWADGAPDNAGREVYCTLYICLLATAFFSINWSGMLLAWAAGLPVDRNIHSTARMCKCLLHCPTSTATPRFESMTPQCTL